MLSGVRSIFLTGSSGFVGKNIISGLSGKMRFQCFQKGQQVKIEEEAVLHLAGKAHDIRNASDAEEYYQVNTELTKIIYDAFLNSEAKVFITLSSVKAVADHVDLELTEDLRPAPLTAYGKSKLMAENYILSKPALGGKRVYILRPCMIHGPENKGNLNLLYKLVSKGLPWPLGSFENRRSFCSIENLVFIINELLERNDIPSGIYNVADDEPISTNEIVTIMSITRGITPNVWRVPAVIVTCLAKIGNIMRLPLNNERLRKLTESYVVSNKKLIKAIGKPLPLTSRQGLLKTLNSFNSSC